MLQESVNLVDFVRKFVANFPLNQEQFEAASEILPSDINWKHMKVRHGVTEYNNQIRTDKPKSHALFTAHFTNDTCQNQTYALQTERHTKLTWKISLQKTYTYGGLIDIKLTPPIIGESIGRTRSLDATDDTFEEELVSSDDSQISVLPHSETKTDLVIKEEEEYTSDFTIKSQFEGKIHVTLRNKLDDTHLTTVTGNVEKIFLGHENKNVVNFVTTGKCKYKLGIEQSVKLSKSKITRDEELH